MTVDLQPPPGADAEPAVIAAWQRQLDYQRLLVSDAHARAQQETAENMLKAADRTAAAQDRFVAAMNAPRPLPTRAALIWQAALEHPPVTGATELNVIDHSVDLVDAFIKRNPGAVQGDNG